MTTLMSEAADRACAIIAATPRPEMPTTCPPLLPTWQVNYHDSATGKVVNWEVLPQGYSREQAQHLGELMIRLCGGKRYVTVEEYLIWPLKVLGAPMPEEMRG